MYRHNTGGRMNARRLIILYIRRDTRPPALRINGISGASNPPVRYTLMYGHLWATSISVELHYERFSKTFCGIFMKKKSTNQSSFSFFFSSDIWFRWWFEILEHVYPLFFFSLISVTAFCKPLFKQKWIKLHLYFSSRRSTGARYIRASYWLSHQTGNLQFYLKTTTTKSYNCGGYKNNSMSTSSDWKL